MSTQIKLKVYSVMARWENDQWECRLDCNSCAIFVSHEGDMSASEVVASILREYGLAEDGIEIEPGQLAAFWDCEPICRTLRIDCETGSCEAWIKRDRVTGLMTLETIEGDHWPIGGCSDRDVQEILDQFSTEDEKWELGWVAEEGIE